MSSCGKGRAASPAGAGLVAVAIGVVGVMSAAVVDGRVGAQLGPPPPRPEREIYSPPVPQPVRRGFDMSAGPYAAGNRGLDYAVRHGTEVSAIGGGTVVFSGPVAGGGWVTVLHPDGLRSSYGPLPVVAVTRGDVVTRGRILGRATEMLHLGVRRHGSYIDPAPLFSPRPRHAHLVAGELARAQDRSRGRPTRSGWPWIRLGLV